MIEQYFKKTWFNIWKSHQNDSDDDDIDFDVIEKSISTSTPPKSSSEGGYRSWTSLAAELTDC